MKIENMNQDQCLNLLENNWLGHLAYIHNEKPYVVPITYFYDKNSNSIISYSGEGHKIEAMRKNSEVVLSIDNITSFSKWKSLQVHGTFQEETGSNARNVLHTFYEGVKGLLDDKSEFSVEFLDEFSGVSISESSNPLVYRIQIKELIGKKVDS